MFGQEIVFKFPFFFFFFIRCWYHLNLAKWGIFWYVHEFLVLLFSLQAELAAHLQSVMVKYLTFLEREKIAAYFVIADFGKCLPQRVALWQRGDAPEGQQIPVSSAASLGGGGTFLWAQGGSWGPGMRKRKVEVGPIPASCCRQKSICFSCVVQLRSQVSGQLVSGTAGSPELVSGGFSASWNAADILLGVFLGKNIAEKMREILLSIKLRLWVCLPHWKTGSAERLLVSGTTCPRKNWVIGITSTHGGDTKSGSSRPISSNRKLQSCIFLTACVHDENDCWNGPWRSLCVGPRSVPSRLRSQAALQNDRISLSCAGRKASA